jgi:hypothetical protein
VNETRWQWFCIAAVLGTYIGSLFLPADRILHMSGAQWCFGFLVETMDYAVGKRPIGFSSFLLALVFSPNILILLGVLTLAGRRYRTTAAIGLAAAACASVSFVLYTTCLDVGYYLWLGSTVILFGGGSGFNRYSRRNKIADSAAGPLPLPDPAALGLFRRASTMARLATDVVAGPLRGNSLSPAKPPCSPSSST